jgi:hypothetical protein
MTDIETNILADLEAIDGEIRKVYPGDSGSGLYSLLSLLAGQFMGVPRSAFTPAPRPAGGEREVEEGERREGKDEPYRA